MISKSILNSDIKDELKIRLKSSKYIVGVGFQTLNSIFIIFIINFLNKKKIKLF